MPLKTSEFDYTLPEELIAHEPSKERGESRLMVIKKSTGTISHHRFSEIVNYVDQGDSLILNNTKVINVRLHGKRASGAQVEIFLLKPQTHNQWLALIKNVKKLSEGETIYIADSFSCALVKKQVNPGEHLIELHYEDASIYESLEKYGQVPLPPYIKHASTETANRFKERYQTVFAKDPGAVAAPTAGLHFDPELLDTLGQKARINYLTLHVGYGTFKPIQTETVVEHKMHEERFDIPEMTAKDIYRAKKEKKQVVAVGTTVARALETAYNNQILNTGPQTSSIYIYPGYTFNCVDSLITNFHLPKSSLLLLVSALAGSSLIREAYEEAIKEQYRFYSFGDAMLILP